MKWPQYYEFRNSTKINAGKDALETIPFELSRMNVSRPIIVTDKGIKGAGLLDTVLKALEHPQIKPCYVYDSVPSDSSIETVNELVELYKEHDCDSIIAIGGGSVIDTCKGLNTAISEGASDLSQLMGVDRLRARQKPFIAIPTTSGTGSEVTLVAVISDTSKGVKLPFVSYNLLPDIAVLDPRMTQSLPPKLTAATGMDALTHAIEAYTCLQKNPLSDAYAWAAIELVREHLFVAVENPSDAKVRFGMAQASLLAGLAFSNSMVGAVHGIGHALGAVAHVHHGNAMAVLLPAVMRFNSDVIGDLYAKLLLPLAGEEIYLSTPKEDRAAKAARVIEEMNNRLNELTGMPAKLSQAGVDEKVFDEVARKALNDGAMSTNPKEVTYDNVIEILKQVF